MINDLSSFNDSTIDDYFSEPSLGFILKKMDCWQFLTETVLALPRSAIRKKLIFYIEEGRRMEGREAVSRMQQIVLFLLPRTKKERLAFETQQALDSLRYYLDHFSANRTTFSL